MFVSLAVAPFVSGIKACRDPQDLIGNLEGEKKKGGGGTLVAAVSY